MVVLLAFALASLEISFCASKKNCLTEEVYNFGGNVKNPARYRSALMWPYFKPKCSIGCVENKPSLAN